MKRYTILLFTFISTSFIAHVVRAQVPYVSWEHNFPLNNYIASLSSKSDNSILYSGNTIPNDSGSCFSNGGGTYESIWFGDLNSSKTTFSDFCFTAGYNTINNGLKVIAESDTLYDIFGFTNDTVLFGVKNHSNTGTSDVFFMKVNSSGVVRSCKLYGSPGDEGFSSAQRTRDGGWIVGATSDDTGDEVPSHYWSTTSSFPTTDDWIVKLDSDGNIQWSDIIGGTGNQYNPQVIQGSDGYYYVCSYSDSHDYDLSGANSDISECALVVKLDSAGNKKLIGLYGGFNSGGVENENAALSQLSNGKLFFSGSSNATTNWVADSISHGYADIWVVELDTALNPLWYHDYGTPGDEETQCADNILMPDGSIVVAGQQGANIYLIRMDSSNGHLIWMDSIYGGPSGETYVTDGISTNNNDIMLCGYSNAYTGIIGDSLGSHSFLIELSDITGIPPIPTSQGNYSLSVYPNPFSQSATIKLDGGNMQHWQFTLQDLLGRTVATYNNEGNISLTITRNDLPAGMYIGIARDDEGQMLGRTKIVVQ